MNCKKCGKDVRDGANVLAVQDGVNGTNGFVPIDERALFCSTACLRKYLDDEQGRLIQLKPRIP